MIATTIEAVEVAEAALGSDADRPADRPADERGTPRGAADPNKKRHNRRAIEDWLRFFNNRFPSAGREGMINLQALPKAGPTFGPLDRGENMERLNDQEAYDSDLFLQGLVKRLAREKWHWYMVLLKAYLDPDASPSVVDEWREDDSLPSRLQLGYHNDAINWLLRETGDYTLVVIVPERGRSDFEANQRARQTQARQVYFSLRDAGVPRNQAVKRTAERTGYSPPSIYRIIGNDPEPEAKPEATEGEA